MPEQAVVETPVVTTPVTTATSTGENPVKVETTPEVDVLTQVTKFKLPDQDKITNPPEQPEFANIADPIARQAAKEAVERIRRGMQSDYTKKLEDAQRLVDQSKNWTPERIQQELLTNPQFVQAAKMVQGQPNERDLTPEEYSALTDREKQELAAVPQLKNEIQQMKQQSANEALRANISQKDNTLREKYADYNPDDINSATVEIAKMNLADVREYIYKAKMHDLNVKKAYEMGKLEGQGKLQSKINTITPVGNNVVTNQGVPTKAAGETDKAFFVRLGQFRLNQFKTQK